VAVSVSLFVIGSKRSKYTLATCKSDGSGSGSGSGNSATDARLAKWAPKWQAGPHKAAWHLGQVVHPRLHEFEHKLIPASSSNQHKVRVLIPLAGKSFDVTHLARSGHAVVAVEGIAQGIDEFESEYGDKSLFSGFLGRVSSWLAPPPFQLDNNAVDRFRLKTARYVHVGAGGGLPSGKVLWLEGDFLLLAQPPASPPQKGGMREGGVCPDTLPDASFDAVFDRGGLVAVDPSDRSAYAAALTRLVAPGGRVLLVAVEHPPFAGGGLGPPFNVDLEAVKGLFSGAFEIEVLKHEDRLPLEPVWGERGCTYFNEVTYLLTRNDN